MVDRRVGEWADGWRVGRMKERMYKMMDGQMGECVDGQITV